MTFRGIKDTLLVWFFMWAGAIFGLGFLAMIVICIYEVAV